jgi:hypothetical protein
MIMTNEYGSAYKRVHTQEEVEDLLATGWRLVEEKPVLVEEPQKEVVVVEEQPVEAPKVSKTGGNELIYKGRYLSQWVSIANKKEMREIFDYYGIPYAVKTSKSDMAVALRKYIREVKADKRREQNDGK